MYRKLLALVNQFVQVERLAFNQSFFCKVLEVTPDTVEVQTYSDQGIEEARWTFPLPTVTGVGTHKAELDRFALAVKWAESTESREEEKETQPSEV